MATETQPDGQFGRVSRVRGLVFEYSTLAASVFGILSLAVLLAFVFWDAFGLGAAESTWIGAFVALVIGPAVGAVLLARRFPVARTVGLELFATTMGGILGGFGVLVILDVIAGPDVWFSYFVAVIAPMIGVVLYGRYDPEANWIGLGVLFVAVFGSVGATLFLDTLGMLEAMLGAPGVYLVSLTVPTALGIRFLVAEYTDLGEGNLAAAAVVAAGAGGMFLVGSVPLVTRSVWLIFLTTFVAPVGFVVARTLADRDRWIGFAGPAAVLAGVGVLAWVTDSLGLEGPSPWFDWQFLTSAPSSTASEAGLYPAIIGSVFIIVLVALITLFLGVGAALYLEEYASSSGLRGKITRLIRINISNLAGVPSVVYGLLGLAMFARLAGTGVGTVMTAALTLSLLILPIVIISAREAIASVPDSLRQASYGMGATRWQTTRRVVLPRAVPGILTGTILALGRAIGETAPLIMIGVATTRYTPPNGLFGKTTAMPMQVFTWANFPSQAFQYGVVAAGVVTLLVVLLTMNSIAVLLRNKFEQGDL